MLSYGSLHSFSCSGFKPDVQIILKAFSAKIQDPGKEQRYDEKAQWILTIALGAMMFSCARAPLLQGCSAVPEIGCRLVEVHEGAS